MHTFDRHTTKKAAVIYTHSHVDHFGGVKGVVSEEEVQAGKIPVLARGGCKELCGIHGRSTGSDNKSSEIICQRQLSLGSSVDTPPS